MWRMFVLGRSFTTSDLDVSRFAVTTDPRVCPAWRDRTALVEVWGWLAGIRVKGNHSAQRYRYSNTQMYIARAGLRVARSGTRRHRQGPVVPIKPGTSVSNPVHQFKWRECPV